MKSFTFLKQGLKVIAFATPLLVHVSHASAPSGCEFNQPLAIDRVSEHIADRYRGIGSRIEVIFRNERLNGPVDVFPEPPLTIQHVNSGKHCEIDGGVWVRAAVYLSGNEKALLVQEYSGSTDELIIYGTDHCEQRVRIDVTGKRWRVSGSAIHLSERCSDDALCPAETALSVEKYCSSLKGFHQ
ncbi:hypothetical protein [Nevskia sp.]|uniref:hypothetical protein n=1 Tax=Nevskia sp. TaxID=1929292 RepID=UPI0025F57391|nr:hypothetical protein [Nevskia sp.]